MTMLNGFDSSVFAPPGVQQGQVASLEAQVHDVTTVAAERFGRCHIRAEHCADEECFRRL